MPNDLIRYDLLVQEALCGVVSKVLADVARHGLPGDHHFYITFRTHAPGVRLSSRMREQYPDEMTIILQHQFEDLKVTDHGFEVGLSFKGIPEILLIPFDALTGFFDPSVQFSLKFEPQTETDEAADAAEPGRGGPPRPEPVKPELARIEPGRIDQGKGEPGKAGPGRPEKPQVVGKPQAVPAPVASVPRTGKAGPPAPPTEVKPPADGKPPQGTPPQGTPAPEPAEEAKVVSIDAFRKKP